MTRHDRFWIEALKRDKTACSNPVIISIALLHRLVDEGRITEQEFNAIDEGFRHRIRYLWGRLEAARKAKEVAK